LVPTPACRDAPDSPGWDWEGLQTLALREASRYLDPDAALDAAQEATLRAWRRAHTCAGEPAPWVRTIARREALRIATRRVEERLPEADELAGACDQSQAATDKLDLAKAMAGLPRDQQQVVFLRYWADQTETDIAASLGTPLGTMKVRLHRARATLARELSSGDSQGACATGRLRVAGVGASRP